jgi:hypothetical protein
MSNKLVNMFMGLLICGMVLLFLNVLFNFGISLNVIIIPLIVIVFFILFGAIINGIFK